MVVESTIDVSVEPAPLDKVVERFAEVDRLDVPDDATLRGDHRAFVRNTEEQADAWRSIAGAGADSADLVTSADLVRQLVLGRNDLAEEMGAPACRREG